jgi:ankyrin repeat protein
MNLPPPPQGNDPIITQFIPVEGQWELTEDNINRIDPETGHTILYNYCFYINTTPREVYQYLIETKGCDVNVQDNYNTNPIYPALRSFDPNKGGDITVLMYLLNQENVNGNIKDKCGETLLHYACNNINNLPVDIFKLLIETMGGDVNIQNNSNQTPIHLAFHCFHPTHGGNITALMYLLSQKDINGNIKDNYGDNLLHMACKYINILPLEIFQHLIKTHGCDVNAQNDGKDTPLHSAFQQFDPNKGGNIAILTYLLSQKGIDGNINGKSGYTILHYPCKRINEFPLEIFKLLIETHGCDVNVQNINKDTPLHDALLYFDPNDGGHITVLTYLLTQKNINVNITSGYGYTILHYACNKINTLPITIFELLIALGADINVQAQNDDTPLHYALSSFNPNDGGDIAVLAYLINQQNLNVKIKDQNGFNLLHTTCMINPSNFWHSAEQNAENDAILSQIVEFIAERCVLEVFEEKTPLEATTTM